MTLISLNWIILCSSLRYHFSTFAVFVLHPHAIPFHILSSIIRANIAFLSEEGECESERMELAGGEIEDRFYL